MVDLEDELFGLRYQWSQMLGTPLWKIHPMKWHDWCLAHE